MRPVRGPLAGGGESGAVRGAAAAGGVLVLGPQRCRVGAGSVLGRRGRQQLVETSERRGVGRHPGVLGPPVLIGGRRGEDLDLGVGRVEVTAAAHPGCAHQRDCAVTADQRLLDDGSGFAAEAGQVAHRSGAVHDGADRVAPRLQPDEVGDVHVGVERAPVGLAGLGLERLGDGAGGEGGVLGVEHLLEVGEGEVVAVDAVQVAVGAELAEHRAGGELVVVRPGHQLVRGGEAADDVADDARRAVDRTGGEVAGVEDVDQLGGAEPRRPEGDQPVDGGVITGVEQVALGDQAAHRVGDDVDVAVGPEPAHAAHEVGQSSAAVAVVESPVVGEGEQVRAVLGCVAAGGGVAVEAGVDPVGAEPGPFDVAEQRVVDTEGVVGPGADSVARLVAQRRERRQVRQRSTGLDVLGPQAEVHAVCPAADPLLVALVAAVRGAGGCLGDAAGAGAVHEHDRVDRPGEEHRRGALPVDVAGDHAVGVDADRALEVHGRLVHEPVEALERAVEGDGPQRAVRHDHAHRGAAFVDVAQQHLLAERRHRGGRPHAGCDHPGAVALLGGAGGGPHPDRAVIGDHVRDGADLTELELEHRYTGVPLHGPGHGLVELGPGREADDLAGLVHVEGAQLRVRPAGLGVREQGAVAVGVEDGRAQQDVAAAVDGADGLDGRGALGLGQPAGEVPEVALVVRVPHPDPAVRVGCGQGGDVAGDRPVGGDRVSGDALGARRVELLEGLARSGPERLGSAFVDVVADDGAVVGDADRVDLGDSGDLAERVGELVAGHRCGDHAVAGERRGVGVAGGVLGVGRPERRRQGPDGDRAGQHDRRRSERGSRSCPRARWSEPLPLQRDEGGTAHEDDQEREHGTPPGRVGRGCPIPPH